jgi:hypothetical protein
MSLRFFIKISFIISNMSYIIDKSYIFSIKIKLNHKYLIYNIYRYRHFHENYKTERLIIIIIQC